MKKKIKAIKRKTHIAGYDAKGKIWTKKDLPKGVKKRLKAHEKREYYLRTIKGFSYKKAHKLALKKEHEGLSKKGIAKYEGKIGAYVRWKLK